VTGEGYAPRGEILKDGKPIAKNPVLETMAWASVLCNESSIHEEGGAWKLTGDPTEGALLPFAAKIGLSAEAEQAAFPRTKMIPFESEHKFMATLHDSVLFVKGAPDVIINYCNCQELSDGSQAPLERKFWKEKNEEIASKGQRVLALACLKNGSIDEVDLTPERLTRELVLLGTCRDHRSAPR
jgi:magnesium-transporting ATPase (P-type)